MRESSSKVFGCHDPHVGTLPTLCPLLSWDTHSPGGRTCQAIPAVCSTRFSCDSDKACVRLKNMRCFAGEVEKTRSSPNRRLQIPAQKVYLDWLVKMLREEEIGNTSVKRSKSTNLRTPQPQRLFLSRAVGAGLTLRFRARESARTLPS